MRLREETLMRAQAIAALSFALALPVLVLAADGKNIVATAKGTDSLKTFSKALVAADLVKTLEGDGPFTVFAPTDAAFEKLPKGALDKLLKDKEKLKALL